MNDPEDLSEINSFCAVETSEIPTQLDGEKLTKEIGGDTLAQEINNTADGAGFKDKADLADLLSSIKGAQIFMNKTPKEQL